MSDVLNKMKSRRSIRKFKPDMVPQEILDQIISRSLCCKWYGTAIPNYHSGYKERAS